jgi:hypothetical protein
MSADGTEQSQPAAHQRRCTPSCALSGVADPSCRGVRLVLPVRDQWVTAVWPSGVPLLSGGRQRYRDAAVHVLLPPEPALGDIGLVPVPEPFVIAQMTS